MSGAWRKGTLRGNVLAAGPLVVKLGGSLLERPGWAGDVADLLGTLPVPRLIVVGGGPPVDGLRAIDRAEPQTADLVHRLAIECMGLTARLVSRTLGVPLVAEPGRDSSPCAVLDAPAWLAHGGRFETLPVGWHVTSDSIAARVAAEHGLPLILVKSAPPSHDDVAHLAAAGWVDAFFPEASRPLASVSWAAPA